MIAGFQRKPGINRNRIADFERIDEVCCECFAIQRFVRRIADERRRASSCFSHIAYPYPPPPAPKNVTDASAEWSLRQQRERLNDLERYEAPRKTDADEPPAEWLTDASWSMVLALAELDAVEIDTGETARVPEVARLATAAAFCSRRTASTSEA